MWPKTNWVKLLASMTAFILTGAMLAFISSDWITERFLRSKLPKALAVQSLQVSGQTIRSEGVTLQQGPLNLHLAQVTTKVPLSLWQRDKIQVDHLRVRQFFAQIPADTLLKQQHRQPVNRQFQKIPTIPKQLTVTDGHLEIIDNARTPLAVFHRTQLDLRDSGSILNVRVGKITVADILKLPGGSGQVQLTPKSGLRGPIAFHFHNLEGAPQGSWKISGNYQKNLYVAFEAVSLTGRLKPSQQQPTSYEIKRLSGQITTTAKTKQPQHFHKISIDTNAQDIILKHPILHNAPVHIASLVSQAELDLHLTEKRVIPRHLLLTLNENIALELREKVQPTHKGEQIYELSMQSMSCQEFIRAMPNAMQGILKNLDLSGHISGIFEIRLSKTTGAVELTRWQPVIACNADPFVIRNQLGWDQLTTARISAPFESIPETLINMVVSAEDQYFWSHQGIQNFAIKSAINYNLEHQAVLRGGSTITMQLVKNLYYDRDRTLSRKLGEAILAPLMEKFLTKQEIVTMYLNIIEFGPGVFGLSQAAQYYFERKTHELSIVQSAFLTALIPNPRGRSQAICGQHRAQVQQRPIKQLKRSMQRLLSVPEHQISRILKKMAFNTGTVARNCREKKAIGYAPSTSSRQSRHAR